MHLIGPCSMIIWWDMLVMIYHLKSIQSVETNKQTLNRGLVGYTRGTLSSKFIPSGVGAMNDNKLP